jgi:uncharacterized SAM-binding protein YcdF (DUF218 family)
MKLRLKLKWALLLVPIFFLGGVMAFLQSYGSRDILSTHVEKEFDAIVIFGARVTATGQASPILHARTRLAFELWQQYRCPIVCTGAIGDHPPAESVVQAKLLEGWGVPKSQILLDQRSTSTRENAQEAAKLLKSGATVLAVSEPFHIYRCLNDLTRAGLKPVPAPEFKGWEALRINAKLFYLLRESIAVCRDAILR